MRALLAALAFCLPAATATAHDMPRVQQPDAKVVVLRPLLPNFGTQAGEGRVRLVYHSPNLATRMGVNDFHAYEQAYQRRLTRLMMRMSFAAADPIARHGAWHDVAGNSAQPEFRARDLNHR